MTLPIAGRVNRAVFRITVDTLIAVVETRDCSNRRGLSTPMPGVHSLGAPYATIQTEQSVAHGAAGRAVSEINVFRRGPVNGVVIGQRESDIAGSTRDS